MVTKLPPEIQDLEDYTESINAIIYGPPGAGKTSATVKLPRTLLVAGEKGVIAAKRQGSKAKVWKVRVWQDLVDAFEWLTENPDVFEWVVIDSITDLQNRAIRAILDAVVADNPKRDPDIPAIQDHYKWQLVMKRMVMDFCDLPVNVLFTAQEMHKIDSENEELVMPLIEGKDYDISAWVCAQVQVVCNIREKRVNVGGKPKVVRQFTFGSNPPYFAKDQYNVLPKRVNDPDFAALMRKITAAETGRPARATAGTARKTAARRPVAKKTTTATRTRRAT